MRLELIIDIEGTDEQCEELLEQFELDADEHVIGSIITEHTERLECTCVSVREIPERQVRGPARPKS